MTETKRVSTWEIKEITGSFWWDLRTVKRVSKELSKRYKIYFSYTKGTPDDPKEPQRCYALTNRYDPKIREINSRMGVQDE